MIDEVLVFATADHPLYKSLNDLDLLNYEKLDKSKLKYIFDFSLEKSEIKKDRFENLFKEYSLPLFCDLSTVNGDKFLEDFPNIEGAFAASFYSPIKTIEAFSKSDATFVVMESFFNFLHLKLLRVKGPGFGFVFPRTVSMIINEAHFALDEYLATENNIDVAMKYGVNYPLGPFEWVDKIGEKSVIYLLEELFNSTQDGRYIVSKALKEKIK
jgi:3-hydroxybutyryl-CoA dehydrogenase